MSSPHKKRIVKSKDGRSDLHNMIDIVVRAVIAEKGYQTKKQVETAIVKSTTELKSLEARIQTMEATISLIKSSAEESQLRLLEKVMFIEKEVNSGDSQKKWASYVSKSIKKHKEDTDVLNKKISEDINNLNQQIIFTKGIVEDM